MSRDKNIIWEKGKYLFGVDETGMRKIAEYMIDKEKTNKYPDVYEILREIYLGNIQVELPIMHNFDSKLAMKIVNNNVKKIPDINAPVVFFGDNITDVELRECYERGRRVIGVFVHLLDEYGQCGYTPFFDMTLYTNFKFINLHGQSLINIVISIFFPTIVLGDGIYSQTSNIVNNLVYNLIDSRDLSWLFEKYTIYGKVFEMYEIKRYMTVDDYKYFYFKNGGIGEFKGNYKTDPKLSNLIHLLPVKLYNKDYNIKCYIVDQYLDPINSCTLLNLADIVTLYNMHYMDTADKIKRINEDPIVVILNRVNGRYLMRIFILDETLHGEAVNIFQDDCFIFKTSYTVDCSSTLELNTINHVINVLMSNIKEYGHVITCNEVLD